MTIEYVLRDMLECAECKKWKSRCEQLEKELASLNSPKQSDLEGCSSPVFNLLSEYKEKLAQAVEGLKRIEGDHFPKITREIARETLASLQTDKRLGTEGEK